MSREPSTPPARPILWGFTSPNGACEHVPHTAWFEARRFAAVKLQHPPEELTSFGIAESLKYLPEEP